ncbi:MAG: hypothetical protein LUD84_09625 [Clostridiales bacterium]|nr:hypothetical protein [Clostridiales bacterium]
MESCCNCGWRDPIFGDCNCTESENFMEDADNNDCCDCWEWEVEHEI